MIHKARSRFWLSVIVAVLFLSCWSCSEGQVSMQVELDVFSGRENPTWRLTTDQTAAVLQRLGSLPDNLDTSPAIFSGLGYRGFLLTDTTTDDRVITVWRETVIIRRGSIRSAKVDRERELEQLLLQTAKSHLAPELFRSVQSQIDEAPDIDKQN